jgi:cellulose synthase/poly-beta-1,6-N-acetylglucosamine synthase-like glycosyltransferase
MDQRESGSIVLLHDGGGDRRKTVEALPQIIAYLRERGDELVTVSELMGVSRDTAMPPLPESRHSTATLASGLGFRILHIGEDIIRSFLALATALVVLRTFLVVTLALIHSRRVRSGSAFFPAVSVLIPAYNEGKVIEKTLRSVLGSEYPGEIEVIVVDDGSTDDTFARASAVGDARVRVVRQANSGKARALECGVREARNDLLVFMDGDTQFAPTAIRHLVVPFQDASVGAVSGHARVGNPRGILTKCQDLEYVCGFNLDRQAYAAWNCITVVPGAISAMRREAIQAAGGFSTDTLAEDTDLTLAIHRAGFRVDYQKEAVAFTEAPETFRGLGRQRFRWAYGTLQCAWKHRDIVFNPRFKALGWFSLPGIWFFQVVLVAFSPFIDLLFLQSILLGRAAEILPYFLVFLGADLLLATVAVWMERMPLRSAIMIIPQRFLYRPLLSYVIWKSIIYALRGAWVGWGKLQRTATVSMP